MLIIQDMEILRCLKVVFGVLTVCLGQQEPTCYSRFDYDHKVMTSLVTLETELIKLKEIVVTQDQEISTLQRQLSELQSQSTEDINLLSRNLKSVQSVVSLEGSGTTFIRWGRTTCPGNGTELVYEGYAGGSEHNERGAAAGYICLPKDPIWDYYEDGHQGGATVRGVEYEYADRNIPNFFGRNLIQNDAPCAVCRTKRPSLVMIPGRNQCYDGWTHEFSGYLSAGHYTQTATEFVCVDKTPEVIPGGTENHNGKLLYFAEVYCGSLKCPPYVQGRELTCVVCSK